MAALNSEIDGGGLEKSGIIDDFVWIFWEPIEMLEVEVPTFEIGIELNGGEAPELSVN